MQKYNITAMVPAKLGSTRLAMKNLALLNGKPLIYYAIKAAKDSGVFSKVIIDAEDAVFSEIAERYGVGFYKRPEVLVSPTTKTDTVVYDFLKNNSCDIVAWVSPIAPLLAAGEVKDIVEYFIREGLDSLMTVKDEQVHCVYKGKPVNYREDEIFAQTQNLPPVQAFVYSVMMWRSRVFVEAFEKNGFAILCGKCGFYPVSKLSSIIVKKEEDLMMTECALKASTAKGVHSVQYDSVVKARRI